MTWSGLAVRRVPLIVIIVLFGISLAFSFRSLLNQERAQKLGLGDNLWVVAQVEFEYLRLVQALDRFAMPSPAGEEEAEAGARRRALNRRLDIFWSRIPLLVSGEEGREFGVISGVHDMARDLEALLKTVEPDLLALRPGDAEAYEAVRGRLVAPAARIHETVLRAFHVDEEAVYFQKAELREAYLMLVVSLLGFLVSGGTLVILLNREIQTSGRAEAMMRSALQEAEAANRAKSDFLAKMSHELRTPLNAIIGFAEVLKMEMLGPMQNPRYREYADDIHRSGKHLLMVIGDILDLAKIEAGKMELREEAFDLAEAIETAVRIVRPDGQETGLVLEQRIQTNLPRLRADGRLIRQMLLNLISNAVKFTPAGGTVRVDAELTSDGEILIRVLDTGIGMTSEEIETALLPFCQVAPPDLKGSGGTGLGLCLVKTFAEMHGAKLLIDSRPGSGTTVTILLPAWRTEPLEAVA